MDSGAFTFRFGKIERELASAVEVSAPLAGEGGRLAASAIWDTGATASSVSRRIVKALDLKPIDVRRVVLADSRTVVCNVYRVDLVLTAGHFPIANVRAAQLETPGSDVLIGMDVIARGDFAVSSFEGQTRLLFRMPSAGVIDFTQIEPD